MDDENAALNRVATDIAQGVDRAVELATGRRIGFTLVVFTEPKATYMSNIARADIAEQLRQLASYLDAHVPGIPEGETS